MFKLFLTLQGTRVLAMMAFVMFAAALLPAHADAVASKSEGIAAGNEMAISTEGEEALKDFNAGSGGKTTPIVNFWIRTKRRLSSHGSYWRRHL